jgi:hypothetical protein
VSCPPRGYVEAPQTWASSACSLPSGESGYWNLDRVTRDCLAVTAACLLTPRMLFLDLGGFDEKRFPVAYNDADYGYRLADAGFRSVYRAEAVLCHHEGLSRGRTDDPRALAVFRQIHGRRVDPYFSPHLDPEHEIFEPRPTVVPIGRNSRPVSVLAVIHSLNWEGAPRFEFELLSRLTAAGSIQAEVISPCNGPMRLAYEQKGIKLRVVPELADMATIPKSYEEGTRYLSGLIRHGRYEVVHANTLESFWGIDAAHIWRGRRRYGASTKAKRGKLISTICRAGSPRRPWPVCRTPIESCSRRGAQRTA